MTAENQSSDPKVQSSPANDYQYCHLHDHTGLTTCQDGHCHIHPGVTSIPIRQEGTHIHEIIGATTYVDGHYHTYRTFTGPAVHLPGGFHTHYVSFTTSFVDGHVHNVMGYVMATPSEKNDPGQQ
ncbi:MAG: YmaF family protein [Peptococcaceae bacterium]|nr:YmaF family protein [Peptococcaceae bacterium]